MRLLALFAFAIVQSAIDLAHSLGLRMVAEGVEDAATARSLSMVGCDEAQGFYFSQALPAADLVQWLTAHELTMAEQAAS